MDVISLLCFFSIDELYNIGAKRNAAGKYRIIYKSSKLNNINTIIKSIDIIVIIAVSKNNLILEFET